MRPPQPFSSRDPGPPTPAEQTIIARILIRHGYPAPPPRTQGKGELPRIVEVGDALGKRG